MTLTALSTGVFFIACHSGSADHFATFAEDLEKRGHEIHVYASGPALQKFEERKIHNVTAFELNSLSSEEASSTASLIAQRCSRASAVITDVGHIFDISIQRAFAIHAPKVVRIAYYDNPEPYVPGGYSAIAAEVMRSAHKVLFANANLAHSPIYQELNREVQIPLKDRIGLGYYPLRQAERIAQRRQDEQKNIRARFFLEHRMRDDGQDILVYFGGNNEEYFTKAFPTFLDILAKSIRQADLSHLIIVFQQHPGAKDKNIDNKHIAEWMKKYANAAYAPKIVISTLPTDDVQVLADKALYYQTSMGPQIVLAGIPAIQIGHNTYEDILIRSRLCPSIVNPSGFISAVMAPESRKDGATQHKDVIYKSLGIRKDWLAILEQAIKHKEK